MPGAGFEPAKQYAEELESTPFDHSGTPASVPACDLFFLTIPLAEHSVRRQAVGAARYEKGHCGHKSAEKPSADQISDA